MRGADRGLTACGAAWCPRPDGRARPSRRPTDTPSQTLDIRDPPGTVDDARPRPGRAPPAPLPTPTTPRFDRGARLAPRALGALSEAPTRASVARRERSYRLLLATADGFAALVALYVAVVVIGDDRLRPGAVLVVPLVIVARQAHGPLRPRRARAAQDDARGGARALPARDRSTRCSYWLLDVAPRRRARSATRQVLGLWGLLFVVLAPRPHARARDRAPASRRPSAAWWSASRDATHRRDREAREADAPREGGRRRAQMPLDGDRAPTQHRVHRADLAQAIVERATSIA